MEDDLRKTTRRRQLKAATIAFNNRHSTMPCVVREISEDGARIEAAGNLVPDTFELLIEIDGLEAHCQVAWRRKNEVGVAFLAPPIRKPPRRAQVVDVVRDKPAGSLLRKKPLLQNSLGARDIPPPPSGIPPPPVEPSAPAAVSQDARPETGHVDLSVPAPAVNSGAASDRERAIPLSQPVVAPAAALHAPRPVPAVQRSNAPPPHESSRADDARPIPPSPQPASAAPPSKPAPAPVRLGLPPAGRRFPRGSRFDLRPVSGLPPPAESAFHSAVTAELRAMGLAAEPGQPAPFSLTGLLSANRSGDTVTFAFLFDVTNRAGRPLHRIAGQETANLYRERPVWNPIEGELSKRIAAVIAHDLASQIGDAT